MLVSSPGSIGSSATFKSGQPKAVAVDSRGIVYATESLVIARYDSQNADGSGVGFLAPIHSFTNEEQQLEVKATAGQFRLSFGGETTGDINVNSPTLQGDIEKALNALLSIGAGNLSIGGLGNGTYRIEFRGTLAHTDIEQMTVFAGTTPYSGGAVSVSTPQQGADGPVVGTPETLAVDPDTDVLYVGTAGKGRIQQLGPLNLPGLTAPPSAVDDTHGSAYEHELSGPLAVEPSTGRLYSASFSQETGPGVLVLDNAGPAPTATLDSLTGLTPHSVTAKATINPNGPPDTRYHFEYSADGGLSWNSTLHTRKTRRNHVFLRHERSTPKQESLISELFSFSCYGV